MSSKKKKRLKYWVLGWFASTIAPLIIKGIKKTISVNEIRPECLIKNDQKVIWIFWHGNMLIPLLVHAELGIFVLISEHGDGALIASIVNKLGCNLVRGSSTRGGSAAFKEMLKLLKKNEGIAITPDGPKGPGRELKMGAVVLAQRSGAPIIPMSGYTNKSKHLDSWDRFLVLKPFAKAVIAYGDPIYIEKDLSEEELEEKRLYVENCLKKLDDEVENYFT